MNRKEFIKGLTAAFAIVGFVGLPEQTALAPTARVRTTNAITAIIPHEAQAGDLLICVSEGSTIPVGWTMHSYEEGWMVSHRVCAGVSDVSPNNAEYIMAYRNAQIETD